MLPGGVVQIYEGRVVRRTGNCHCRVECSPVLASGDVSAPGKDQIRRGCGEGDFNLCGFVADEAGTIRIGVSTDGRDRSAVESEVARDLCDRAPGAVVNLRILRNGEGGGWRATREAGVR